MQHLKLGRMNINVFYLSYLIMLLINIVTFCLRIKQQQVILDCSVQSELVLLTIRPLVQ